MPLHCATFFQVLLQFSGLFLTVRAFSRPGVLCRLPVSARRFWALAAALLVLWAAAHPALLNAAAALTAGVLAGGDVAALAQGISEFSGVRRRFEFHGAVAGGDYRGVEVYDDYAHHPTEVRAVLTAAREKLAARGSGQVIVVFQPHMYSRTQEFAAEFAEALSLADAAVVLDIYGAREQPHDGITSQLIIDRMTNKVVHQPNFSLVPQTVAELAHPGDMVITMGAGDVTVLADEILFQLRTDD